MATRGSLRGGIRALPPGGKIAGARPEIGKDHAQVAGKASDGTDETHAECNRIDDRADKIAPQDSPVKRVVDFRIAKALPMRPPKYEIEGDRLAQHHRRVQGGSAALLGRRQLRETFGQDPGDERCRGDKGEQEQVEDSNPLVHPGNVAPQIVMRDQIWPITRNVSPNAK